MGHGDELRLQDANFPGSSYRPTSDLYGRTWCSSGFGANLQVLPLDTYSSYQAGLMQVVPGRSNVPVIWDEYKRLFR